MKRAIPALLEPVLFSKLSHKEYNDRIGILSFTALLCWSEMVLKKRDCWILGVCCRVADDAVEANDDTGADLDSLDDSMVMAWVLWNWLSNEFTDADSESRGGIRNPDCRRFFVACDSSSDMKWRKNWLHWARFTKNEKIPEILCAKLKLLELANSNAGSTFRCCYRYFRK